MRYSQHRWINHNQINKPQINKQTSLQTLWQYNENADLLPATSQPLQPNNPQGSFFVFLVILVMEPGTLSVLEECDVILIFTPTFTTKATLYSTKFARNYTHHTIQCHNLEDHSMNLHCRENLHSYTPQKGKAIPSQTWTGPECFRRLRIPDFKTVGTWRW
jgi:hypothetical protein